MDDILLIIVNGLLESAIKVYRISKTAEFFYNVFSVTRL